MGVNARRIRIIKANGNSGCKSIVFASLPIKSSNGAHRDRYVIIATKTRCLERNRRARSRDPWEGWKRNLSSGGGSLLLLIWTGSFPRVLSERIFFLRAFLREARLPISNVGTTTREFRQRIIRESGNGDDNPQGVFVELILTWSISDLIFDRRWSNTSPKGLLNRLCLRETRVSALQVEFCSAKDSLFTQDAY